ncbi:MAG: Bax inhibitor-1 family protein [Patescibacteria group bacterium]
MLQNTQASIANNVSRTFFGQVMAFFGLALAAAAGGVLVGFYLLPAALIYNTGFMLLMFAVTLILVFTSRRWSRGRLGYFFLIVFAAIFGLTFVPLLAITALTAGAPLIGKALLATVTMFGGMALYGITTKRDLSGLGGALIASLIGMIVVSLLTFVLYLFGISVWSNATELVFSGFGILVFAGFTMYDFQKIRSLSGQITPIEGAIKIFLDFILLFQYILRFMTALGRD